MHKKFHLNPILKKELMVGSRSIKMSWAIFGFNAFLSVIVVFTMLGLEFNSMYYGYSYKNLVSLFPILGTVECVVLSLLIPIITSGSISGERERQTLDIMLTTPVKPMAIALGKLGSAMMMVMMYMISSIPVLSVAFVLGGLNWSALLGLLGMMLYIGIYVGSIGIFCSSVVKKSIASTVLTLVIGMAINIVTLVCFGILIAVKATAVAMAGTGSISITYEPLILLLNPYSSFLDFMLRSVTSFSIYEWIMQVAPSNRLPAALDVCYRFWIPISLVLNLVISAGFLKLAANNICVIRNKRRRK